MSGMCVKLIAQVTSPYIWLWIHETMSSKDLTRQRAMPWHYLALRPVSSHSLDGNVVALLYYFALRPVSSHSLDGNALALLCLCLAPS